jgi:hypothetical protein
MSESPEYQERKLLIGLNKSKNQMLVLNVVFSIFEKLVTNTFLISLNARHLLLAQLF